MIPQAHSITPMASQKLLLLIFTSLPIIFVKITYAEEYLTFQDHNDAVSQATAADASFELELRGLKLKISSLETSIDEKSGELKEKDGSVVQLEKVIEEKSNVLASLESTVRSLQDKGSLGVKNRLREVQRTNNEQKSKILDTQHALHVAEEEMLKAKLEASSITKQLKEVHQAWLPYWFSAHLVYCQTLKKKSEIEKWMQPHLETFNTVQSNLHKALNSYKLTEPLATEGLVWFMASVLMALPVVILSRLLIREGPKNHRRKTQTSHTHRRTKKRAQPDK